MPQKRNHAGNMQNYVPAGNGDASGEYGDNATGSNVHFKTFKKPDGENDSLSDADKEKEKVEKVTEKVKTIGENYQKIYENAEKKPIFMKYHNKQVTIFDNESSYQESINSGRGFFYNYGEHFKFEELPIFNDEEKKEIINNYVDEIDLDLELPSYTTESELLQLMPSTSDTGLTRLMKAMNFGDSESNIYKLLFRNMYGDVIDSIAEKTTEKIDEKRKVIGEEYVKNNYNKVNDGFGMFDALKMANPKYDDDYDYRRNCQRCAITYELLRRGYDVQAKPNNDGYGANRKWVAQLCWKERQNITAGNYKAAKKQIDEIIRKAGDGARYCIAVQWKGDCGHVFCGENVNGKIIYVDPQVNEYDIGDDHFSKVQSKSPIFVGRMDNADFSGSIEKTAVNREVKDEQ